MPITFASKYSKVIFWSHKKSKVDETFISL